MSASRTNESFQIKAGNRELKEVDNFKYLGSNPGYAYDTVEKHHIISLAFLSVLILFIPIFVVRQDLFSFWARCNTQYNKNIVT